MKLTIPYVYAALFSFSLQFRHCLPIYTVGNRAANKVDENDGNSSEKHLTTLSFVFLSKTELKMRKAGYKNWHGEVKNKGYLLPPSLFIAHVAMGFGRKSVLFALLFSLFSFSMPIKQDGPVVALVFLFLFRPPIKQIFLNNCKYSEICQTFMSLQSFWNGTKLFWIFWNNCKCFKHFEMVQNFFWIYLECL